MNHEGIVFSGNTLVFLLILLLLGVTGYLIYKISILQKEKKALTEDKKVLKNRLGNIRLDYIETKLNPHLFKNILNSVQSHAYQTYVSLDKLSGVLDYILYEKD